MNLSMGAALIPVRIPAYDIPTLRAFAVGVGLGCSFATLTLYYRFCLLPQYT